MRAEFWAILTAVCWAGGSLLEKKGIKIGHFDPRMGAAIRTFFSLIMLTALSYPYWGQMKTAGAKSITLIAVGGGIFAGGLGLICLYAGIKAGNLSTVLVIAFCLTAVFGVILGLVFLKEKLNLIQVIGIVFCIAGAAVTVYFKTPAPEPLPADGVEQTEIQEQQ